VPSNRAHARSTQRRTVAGETPTRRATCARVSRPGPRADLPRGAHSVARRMAVPMRVSLKEGPPVGLGALESRLGDPPAADPHPAHRALAERVLLPGDPGRALALAQELLLEPRMFNHHRGLWATPAPPPTARALSIQATGMGGPSAAIVLTELIASAHARGARGDVRSPRRHAPPGRAGDRRSGHLRRRHLAPLCGEELIAGDAALCRALSAAAPRHPSAAW